MRYSNYLLGCILTLPLYVQAQESFQDQLQQAGAISQELNQQRKRLEKPDGQLFKQPVHIHSQSNNALRFELNQIHIKLLNETGLETPVKQDLSHLIKPYLNKSITLDDLNQLTEKITQYYREHNYLVARAFLPPQEIENGELTIGVMEGNIGKINIDNQSKLSANFVRRMANTSINSQRYLSQTETEKLALLLNDIQGIKSKLSVQAGEKTGTTDVNILLQDAKRWQAYVFSDNQGSTSTGRYRISAGGKLFNLAGLGDELSINALSSQNRRLKNIRIEYSALLDGYGTKIGTYFSYLNYKLGGDFAALNAKGYNQNVGIYLLHPTIRQPDLHVNTKLTLSHNRIADSQVASQEVENHTRINLVNLELNGVWNSLPKGTTYFNMAMSIGQEHNQTSEAYQNRPLDWQENNKFTLTNIELGHEQILPYDFAFDINVKGQLSDRNLSSNQKMLLGGQSAVRGYRAGAVSLSDAIIGQFTLKHYYPLFKESLLTTSAFYDIGAGKKYHKISTYNQRPEETNQIKLQSIGAGFQLSAPNNYSINAYYSRPIGHKLANEKDHQFVLSCLKLF